MGDESPSISRSNSVSANGAAGGLFRLSPERRISHGPAVNGEAAAAAVSMTPGPASTLALRFNNPGVVARLDGFTVRAGTRPVRAANGLPTALPCNKAFPAPAIERRKFFNPASTD